MSRQKEWKGGPLSVVASAALVFLVVPIVIVIPMSFSASRYLEFPPKQWSIRWYKELFSRPEWYEPLARSLVIASLVAALCVLLAATASYGLIHCSARWRRTLSLVFITPLVTPPVVLGCALLLVFSTVGLADTIAGIVCGHLLLALPYGVLVFSSALARIDLDLEDAACSLGASRGYAFARVTVPQLVPAGAATAALSFLVSFDEPVLVLFIASSRAKTLPRQMFDAIRYDLDPTAAAVASILATLCLILGFVSVFRKQGNNR